MTVNAINGVALATLSAVNGVALSGLAAINGQTKAAGASFPVNGVLDTFNRANANPLDGSWTQGIQGALDGDLKIVSNKLLQASAGVTDVGRASWNTSFNADQEAYLTIDTRAGGAIHEVWFRLDNAGAAGITGYKVEARTNDNDVRAIRYDNSLTGTVIATIGQTLSDGDAFGANVVGSLGTVYYKVGAGAWTSIGTFDASVYTNAGKIGVGVGTSGTETADDFGGGNV